MYTRFISGEEKADDNLSKQLEIPKITLEELHALCLTHCQSFSEFIEMKTLCPKDVLFERTPKKVEKSNPNNPLEFLRAFFNFGYYFCYLPYRFQLMPDGSYAVRTTKLHQACCGVIHIFTLLRFLAAIREVEIVRSDPSSYFEVVRNAATFAYTFAFMYSFWMKKGIFSDIFSSLQQLPRAQLDISLKLAIRWIAIILCTCYAIVSFLNFALGLGIVGIHELTIPNMWRGHAGHALFMFFLRNNFTSLTNEDIDLPISFLTGAHLIFQFYFKFGAHYTELSILMCALTLRFLTKGFANSIKHLQGNHVSQVLEQFSTMKILSKKINLAIGTVTLWCILEAMPYYATHIGDILNKSDWLVRFKNIFFVVNFFSIVVFAADISHQVDSLRIWFNTNENHNTVPSSKLVMLLNELSTHPIGLSANGLFTITYGFVGTIASIVLTYAVINLQFKSAVGVCHANTTVSDIGH